MPWQFDRDFCCLFLRLGGWISTGENTSRLHTSVAFLEAKSAEKWGEIDSWLPFLQKRKIRRDSGMTWTGSMFVVLASGGGQGLEINREIRPLPFSQNSSTSCFGFAQHRSPRFDGANSISVNLANKKSSFGSGKGDLQVLTDMKYFGNQIPC